MATRTVIHLSKNNSSWDPVSQGLWVTKTDVVELHRCAYRVFLAHQQRRPYSEYLTKPVQQLLSLGISTEERVVSQTVGHLEHKHRFATAIAM